jgi:drug/metabolite transporter (DMT)-like permease
MFLAVNRSKNFHGCYINAHYSSSCPFDFGVSCRLSHLGLNLPCHSFRHFHDSAFSHGRTAFSDGRHAGLSSHVVASSSTVSGALAQRHCAWHFDVFLLAMGCVVWAEQHISSSVAALLITTEPLWIVLLQWLALGGETPSTAIWFGLFVGTLGAILLVGNGLFSEGLHIDYAGVAAVIAATLAWAIGSLYVRRASWPSSALQATSMQMLVGGLLQLTVGTMRGEWSQFSLTHVAWSSWVALGYLIIFGSIVAYTAYNWLARVAPPSRVATYAYVNPVIAVFLGWGIGREPITGQMLVAAALMVLAVFVITTKSAPEL